MIVFIITFARGKEVLIMIDNATKNAAIKEAKGLAKWFKIELKISLFGQVIFDWTWPPQADE